MRKYALVAALWAVALPLSPALAAPMHGYAVRTTTMLSGPDFDYPAVQRVRRNAGITVYGCLRDWSWCDVSNRAARGWVTGNDIVVNYQGRRQSILPTMGIGVLSFVFGSYWDRHYRSRSFYSQRPRYEQQYNTGHRPQWGPYPGAPGIGPQYGQPDRGPQRGVIRQRPTMPPRQVTPPRAAPQQHQPGMGQPGAGQRPNRPTQRPDRAQPQPQAPRVAPPQRQPGAMQRQNGAAQQRSAPERPAPQGRQVGPGNGNRGNGQAPGQQRGGRPAGQQGRPNQNQRPSD
ncbi:hypothetical protein [Novosphingobium sp.]|uniref:SH3 domain-containing protein n=1 Tax=Novosphingobium sp. TaxID=1874826 RepID=UPI00333E32F6